VTENHVPLALGRALASSKSAQNTDGFANNIQHEIIDYFGKVGVLGWRSVSPWFSLFFSNSKQCIFLLPQLVNYARFVDVQYKANS